MCGKKNGRIMKWWHVSIILCSYGFFKEFRPSEPFITPYLTTFKNFTIKEINQKIFPVGTYSYLSLLIVVFLLTDFLRYKPVLLAGSISGVITWSLLIWGTMLAEMQVVEFFYGLFLASEVAYYTYIYAKVDKKHYQKVTSHTRAAILLGRAIAGLSSQLLIKLNINYLELNYFSICGIGITIVLGALLPNVPQSIYFHRKKSDLHVGDEEVRYSRSEGVEWSKSKSELETTNFTFARCRAALKLLSEDFKQMFTNEYVLQWSIWWALATCGYLQAISYCQLLWQDIVETENSTLYHGYVEFTYAVSGATVAFLVGYLKINWKNWGEIFLGCLTICQGGFLFYSAYLNNLYLAYAIFILYRDFYEAAITIATCEIAKFISQDSYALVFGINTFLALVFQTILTTIALETLEINIRHQYEVYGGYHFVIGIAFLVYGMSTLIFCRGKDAKK